MLHNKFSKAKTLIWNFVSGLTSIIFALSAYFFVGNSQNIIPYLSAFTAGAFIYIALADIVPELKVKHEHLGQGIISLFFLLGIFIIGTFVFISSH